MCIRIFIFVLHLRMLSVGQMMKCWMAVWIVNNNLKISGKKRSWPNFMYYPGIGLQGLRKTTKDFSKASLSHEPIFEPGTPEYEERAVSTLPPFSVETLQFRYLRALCSLFLWNQQTWTHRLLASHCTVPVLLIFVFLTSLMYYVLSSPFIFENTRVLLVCHSMYVVFLWVSKFSWQIHVWCRWLCVHVIREGRHHTRLFHVRELPRHIRARQ
jgi:hypothetical protein